MFITEGSCAQEVLLPTVCALEEQLVFFFCFFFLFCEQKSCSFFFFVALKLQSHFFHFMQAVIFKYHQLGQLESAGQE